MRRLALLSVLSLCGCATELLHGLDERQANEVCAELDARGIPAEKSADDRPGSFLVSVPRTDAARAISALAARDLPRQGGKGVGETFADPGLLPSPAAERARLSASLAVDLERTLEAIPGVTAARVHLALPDVDPLRENGRPRVTCAVLLRTRAVLPLGGDEIKRVIAGAVEGLSPEGVTLAFAPETEPASAPTFARLGPIALAPGSRPTAVALLSATVALLFLLGGAVVALFLRLRLRPARPET